MKTLLSTLTITAILALTTQANSKIKDPQIIYQKKCAMCHVLSKPETKEEKMKLVAPPIMTAMAGVVITLDALEAPEDENELKKISVEFLKDYLLNPNREKTNCEDFIVEKFGMMPSLKGFISQEQLDIVVPWAYDTFKPQKINGEYKKVN